MVFPLHACGQRRCARTSAYTRTACRSLPSYRNFRQSKPIFAMDFQNDGQYVGGCIAGGRRYMHINARGDVEPCVFIHYSNCNIRNCTLLEARNPLFSWLTTDSSLSMKICSSLVLCWKIQKNSVPLSKRPERCPLTTNPPKMWIPCVTAQHLTQRTGSLLPMLCGKHNAKHVPITTIVNNPYWLYLGRHFANSEESAMIFRCFLVF